MLPVSEPPVPRVTLTGWPFQVTERTVGGAHTVSGLETGVSPVRGSSDPCAAGGDPRPNPLAPVGRGDEQEQWRVPPPGPPAFGDPVVHVVETQVAAGRV